MPPYTHTEPVDDAQATHAHPYQMAVGWVLLTLAMPLLWRLTQDGQSAWGDARDFKLWQTSAEILCVVLATLVFITGYRAIASTRQGAATLLGVGFLGVAVFNLIHLLSLFGLPGRYGLDAPLMSAVFWLATRLLATASLLYYTVSRRSSGIAPRTRRLAVVAMLVVAYSLGYAGLHWSDQLAEFLPGLQNQNPELPGFEWAVVAMSAIAVVVLWRRRKALQNECLVALRFSAAFLGVSALCFMQTGINVSDASSASGYFYTLVAFLYLFHATFNESISRPLVRLQMQLNREQHILEAAPDAVMWVDTSGVILFGNPAVKELTGYVSEELVGRNVSIFLPEPLREKHARSIQDYFTKPHSRAMGLMDIRLQRKDGTSVPVDISLGHWVEDGVPYAIAYIRDLTERKRFEESLRHRATHDELTGLANRWLFRLQLGQAVARAARNGQQVAILFIDLDDFKNVNDSFGHASGDALLVQTGARIRSQLRESDTLARMGGDEFAILLTDLSDVSEALGVASKIVTHLQLPYPLQDQEVHSGASVGLAFFPSDGRDSETLLRYADMAMYQAKRAGRGTYACYSKDMDAKVREDMRMHGRLKDAILQKRLQLHYQPQVDVSTGLIVGAEALLRWNDPVLGDVSPSRFIPLAESTGLILPLSEWVLEAACQQIAQWADAGTPLCVAVNFSAQQFRQADLPARVHRQLQAAGAQADLLVVEITETVAMAQPEQAREQLNALVALGCQVALDDFGTGYSSLAYLKVLPVNKLKIDKRFTEGVPDDLNDAAIAKAIILLAHSLGMTLVAEGVETPEQLGFLHQHGCELYQGWLYSKAIEASSMTSLLQVQLREISQFSELKR
ncbi:EAL domain-containing protein [Rhodoferax sp. GW822-FHT02A01]|uniref:bifunctional diguanylate cyclase/phosphodiesterase n=1 Tax=Rhodoferax sp. GW822-FHT02A01 TaxID=3141537 RepID=UPI00315CCEB9